MPGKLSSTVQYDACDPRSTVAYLMKAGWSVVNSVIVSQGNRAISTERGSNLLG